MNADPQFRRSTVASSDTGCRVCGKLHVVTEASVRELMEMATRFAVFERSNNSPVDVHEIASIVIERYLRLVSAGRACPETWSDAYVRVVVRNTVRDQFRREMRQRDLEVSLSESVVESLGSVDDEYPSSFGEVAKLMGRLPPREREILELAAMGLSLRRISEELHLTRSSCHRALSAATQKLRRMVAQENAAERRQLGDRGFRSP